MAGSPRPPGEGAETRPSRGAGSPAGDGRDGDSEQAQLLRALYDEHATALWRYTYSLVGDSGRAEDIVQETLLRAWQRLHVLDQTTASARAWLFTVARNLAVDEHRSARRRREYRTDKPPEQPTPDQADRAVDGWLIADALARLSTDHREVIVRAYYRGLSTQQIATELAIPEGTVKSRMHYGMRALRSALQQMGVTK
ncbi:sigma-70 family RNA polymerase sigma factor [Nocardia transvalensis]|uniref:sigma-70 family RNA polymerase sigma factor n=1 Tax=Nocardia transvalensis TaxID=37333 RepID=UPI001E2C45DA|nr:sigma-70 family RNA polymerase sigma factor [Nocardia transvalensis]